MGYYDFEEPYDPLLTAYEEAMDTGDYAQVLALNLGASQVAIDGAAQAGFAEGVRAASQAHAAQLAQQQPPQSAEQEAKKAEAYQNFLAETEQASKPESAAGRIVRAGREDSMSTRLPKALAGLKGGAGARELERES